MPTKPTARFYLVLIVIISLLLSFGCNPAKRLQKNNEQYEKIITDYLIKHPAKIDTLTELIPGGVDSVFYPVAVVDSNRLQQLKDSLQAVFANKENDCTRQINEAFTTGYEQATYELKKQKFAKPRPDTVRLKITNRDYEDALKRKIESLQNDLSKKDKTIFAKTNTMWWLIAVIAFETVAIFLIVRKK